MQRCFDFSFGDLVEVQRRRVRGNWGLRADRFLPKRLLMELTSVKLPLLGGLSLHPATFRSDLRQARDDGEAHFASVFTNVFMARFTWPHSAALSGWYDAILWW